MTSPTRSSSSMTPVVTRTMTISTSASKTRRPTLVRCYAHAVQVTLVDKIRSPTITESRPMVETMDTKHTLQACLNCSTLTKSSQAAAMVTHTPTTAHVTSPVTEVTAVRLSIFQTISSLSTSAARSTEHRVTRSTRSVTVQCSSVLQVRPTVHR